MGGNEAIYLGMEIPKVNNDDSDGIVSGSDKYEEKINHIEIPHARTRTPKEPLAEAERANSRPDLGKLMRIARIARPDVIYDALAAAQTFPDGEIIDFLEKGDAILANEEKGAKGKKKKEDFGHMHGFTKFMSGEIKEVNKVNLPKRRRKLTTQKHILRYRI